MVASSAYTVYLLRSASDPDPYLAAFVEAGMKATCVPVLRFTFPHQDALRRRLRAVDRYAGLVVTSPRAVQAMQKAWRDDDALHARWQDKPAYAVGPKTASVLGAEGLHPVGAGSGSAAALASVIANKNPGGPLLFLSGNRRRDTLPSELADAGIAFDEQVVYRTHTRTDIRLPGAQAGDWLVFFSPSGGEAVRQSPAVEPGRFRIGAIGPTTAAALEEEGMPVEAVAASPTPEALRRAIQAAVAG